MSACDKCGRGFGSARSALVDGLELCARCARDVSVLVDGFVIPVDGFTHDGNDWSHCGRVVFSGDLWAECGKCGAVMSWEDGEVVL